MASKENPTPEDLGMTVTQTNNTDENPPEENPTTEAPKKRGRPKGSTNAKPNSEQPRKSANRQAADVAAFGQQLVGIHKLVAMATSLPIMQIDDTEGLMLAKGINAVAEEYGIAMTGKMGAALQLFGAAAMVYAPRAIVIMAQMKAAKQAQANIVDVPVNAEPANH